MKDWIFSRYTTILENSPRGYHYFNDTIKIVEGVKVRLQTKEDADYIYTKYRTPKGNLTQVERKTEYGTASLRTEYFLKTTEDFEALTYVIQHQSSSSMRTFMKKEKTFSAIVLNQS